MPATHFIFIPAVLLLGIVIGWVLGSRAAKDAYAAELRKREERAARRRPSEPGSPGERQSKLTLVVTHGAQRRWSHWSITGLRGSGLNPRTSRDVRLEDSLRLLTPRLPVLLTRELRCYSTRTSSAFHSYTPFSSRTASHGGRPAWRMRAWAPLMS